MRKAKNMNIKQIVEEELPYKASTIQVVTKGTEVKVPVK